MSRAGARGWVTVPSAPSASQTRLYSVGYRTECAQAWAHYASVSHSCPPKGYLSRSLGAFPGVHELQHFPADALRPDSNVAVSPQPFGFPEDLRQGDFLRVAKLAPPLRALASTTHALIIRCRPPYCGSFRSNRGRPLRIPPCPPASRNFPHRRRKSRRRLYRSVG